MPIPVNFGVVIIYQQIYVLNHSSDKSSRDSCVSLRFRVLVQLTS